MGGDKAFIKYNFLTMNFDIVKYWGNKKKKKNCLIVLKTAACVPLNQLSVDNFLWLLDLPRARCSQSIYLPVKHLYV